MKKTYITPQVEVMEVIADQLLASSPTLGINNDADPIDGGQALGREDRPSTPDIWSQGW